MRVSLDWIAMECARLLCNYTGDSALHVHLVCGADAVDVRCGAPADQRWYEVWLEKVAYDQYQSASDMRQYLRQVIVPRLSRVAPEISSAHLQWATR